MADSMPLWEFGDMPTGSCRLIAVMGTLQKETAMIDQDKVHKAEYLLKMTLLDPSKASQLSLYPWASEASRWDELVTITLCRFCEAPEDDLRDLTKYLSNLGHLEIGELADLKVLSGTLDRTDEKAATILSIFRRKGIPEDSAAEVLTLLHNVAVGLTAAFGGCIQRYLRSYGEKMLDDLAGLFPPKGSANDDLRQIVAMWLQAVLNMPVPLRDPVIAHFCKAHDITPEELVQAADNINLNVAILDEMVRLELADARKSITAPAVIHEREAPHVGS